MLKKDFWFYIGLIVRLHLTVAALSIPEVVSYLPGIVSIYGDYKCFADEQ